MKRARTLRLWIGVIVLGGLPGTLAGQAPRRDVSIAIGAMSFDASGTGTVPVATLKASAPVVTRWLLAEVGVSYASLSEQFRNAHTRIGIAEGQVQLQLPGGKIQPYIGGGGGWLHYFDNAAGQRPSSPVTISGAAGIRTSIVPAVRLSTEARLRGWQGSRDWSYLNSAMHYTVGLGSAF